MTFGGAETVIKEAQRIMNGLRLEAQQSDVRGGVTYVAGILSSAGVALEDVGTSRRELAELIRIGLVSQAIYSLEKAKTHLLVGMGMSEVQVASALVALDDASSFTDGAAEHEIDSAEVMLSIFGRAEQVTSASPASNEPTEAGGDVASTELQRLSLDDQAVENELKTQDPFTLATERVERGDTTLQFLTCGQLPTAEVLEQRCAEADCLFL